jgi:hypothetical protein
MFIQTYLHFKKKRTCVLNVSQIMLILNVCSMIIKCQNANSNERLLRKIES